MIITGKKRIRKCSKYLSHLSEGSTAYIGLPITEDISSKLKEIGFENATVGETLIPSPKLGNISKFNSNGKEIPQKDLPKETAYRQQHWEWEDWQGTHYSRTVDIPYKRYPRKLIPAPWVSLLIIQSNEKHFVIAGEAIVIGQTSEEDITHRINLILEIFKSVYILQENLELYEIPKIKRLDWDVLPAGKMPWEHFKANLTPILDKKSKGKKKIVSERLETISEYKPDFHAIGKNGYRGYIIFGFTKLDLYIFETAEYGNATYIFEGNWEQLSQMSKAEIIAEKLHKHRLIHLDGWSSQIASLFPSGYKKLIS
ncbi:hypothetical protein [Metabacillus indicus]|uniref:hypothetical protein n=1 Tax=Metabacillus indicus TaxID=246786 RepID=UPI00069167BF|nr:hypothetical protein [Metabacillus indicus]